MKSNKIHANFALVVYKPLCYQLNNKVNKAKKKNLLKKLKSQKSRLIMIGLESSRQVKPNQRSDLQNVSVVRKFAYNRFCTEMCVRMCETNTNVQATF